MAKSDSFEIPEVPATSDVNTEELQEVKEAENVDDIVEPEPEEPLVEKKSKEEGE